MTTQMFFTSIYEARSPFSLYSWPSINDSPMGYKFYNIYNVNILTNKKERIFITFFSDSSQHCLSMESTCCQNGINSIVHFDSYEWKKRLKGLIMMGRKILSAKYLYMSHMLVKSSLQLVGGISHSKFDTPFFGANILRSLIVDPWILWDFVRICVLSHQTTLMHSCILV